MRIFESFDLRNEFVVIFNRCPDESSIRRKNHPDNNEGISAVLCGDNTDSAGGACDRCGGWYSDKQRGGELPGRVPARRVDEENQSRIASK